MHKLIALASITFCLAVVTLAPVQAAAPMSKATTAPKPTPAPPASAAEKQFVDSVSKDLQARFGTTAEAAAGGYLRYTDEDQTGAISWVNTANWKSDATHPSQLWYDVKGQLIGADFSVLEAASPKRPTIWGVSARRWLDFSPAHVHFGIKSASGVQFGGVGPKSMKQVGGLVGHPTAADIVKLGKIDRWKMLKIPPPRTTSDVAFVFPFPAVWDLQVWLVPNPLGAFAEHNPNVKPSSGAKYQD